MTSSSSITSSTFTAPVTVTSRLTTDATNPQQTPGSSTASAGHPPPPWAQHLAGLVPGAATYSSHGPGGASSSPSLNDLAQELEFFMLLASPENDGPARQLKDAVKAYAQQNPAGGGRLDLSMSNPDVLAEVPTGVFEQLNRWKGALHLPQPTGARDPVTTRWQNALPDMVVHFGPPPQSRQIHAQTEPNPPKRFAMGEDRPTPTTSTPIRIRIVPPVRTAVEQLAYLKQQIEAAAQNPDKLPPDAHSAQLRRALNSLATDKKIEVLDMRITDAANNALLHGASLEDLYEACESVLQPADSEETEDAVSEDDDASSDSPPATTAEPTSRRHLVLDGLEATRERNAKVLEFLMAHDNAHPDGRPMHAAAMHAKLAAIVNPTWTLPSVQALESLMKKFRGLASSGPAVLANACSLLQANPDMERHDLFNLYKETYALVPSSKSSDATLQEAFHLAQDAINAGYVQGSPRPHAAVVHAQKLVALMLRVLQAVAASPKERRAKTIERLNLGEEKTSVIKYHTAVRSMLRYRDLPAIQPKTPAAATMYLLLRDNVDMRGESRASKEKLLPVWLSRGHSIDDFRSYRNIANLAIAHNVFANLP